MTLLIQDGRRGGHLRWAVEAVSAGLAGGVIISPFHTPRVAVPRHKAGSTVAKDVSNAGGEVFFDASTHARLLPNTDDLVHYSTWQLWGPSGVGLDTEAQRLEHIERVFARQGEMSVQTLAPTVTLDSPLGQPADHAFRTAQLGSGVDPRCGQAVAGRRSFWRAGPDLDAYVGQLASLRAPIWTLTVVNDVVEDNAPDLTDTVAFAGLLRTVHSLSQRSRVIICHADYSGIPAIAAGATDLGVGWDRGMRFFDPRSFQIGSPGIQIPASYVTQGGLGAVLRRDAGDAITRLGEALATQLRGGPMPADDTAERIHHLVQLRNLLNLVASHGTLRTARVGELRGFYETAIREFDQLLGRLPRQALQSSLRKRWTEEPLMALQAYAEAEKLWY